MKGKGFERDLLIALGSAGLTCLGALLLGKPLVNRAHDAFLKRILTDPYDQNLWEFVSATYRTGPQNIVENALRAQAGKLIQRPLGSTHRYPGTDGLVFNFAQLATPPISENVPVDTSVVIGPQAKQPLKLNLPILIPGMAFGLSLSGRAKVALAKGATMAGTASNTGEGPLLPAERRAAKRLIVQYERSGFNHRPEILRQADAVEILFGTGARGGLGHVTDYEKIPPRARRLMGLKPNQPAVSPATMPGITDPRRDLPPLVRELRRITGGVPIGAKISAGLELEADLAILAQAGVDFIAVSGAEAGTWGSPPFIQDSFGLPAPFAVNRANTFLAKAGVKGRVSLIAGGGMFTPDDMMKAIALGADAVGTGTMALFALTHNQVAKAMPWEPPTQLVFPQGKYKDRLDVELAAKNLANLLIACDLELKEGLRAMGKHSLKELSKADLAALDAVTAKNFGVPEAARTPV